jgi:hypothetical protein
MDSYADFLEEFDHSSWLFPSWEGLGVGVKVSISFVISTIPSFVLFISRKGQLPQEPCSF